MFNSLKYVKILEEVGLTREQAETHIFIMTEVMETNLATKEDVKDLRQETKTLAAELRHEMKEMEYRLTLKLGTIISVAISIAVALIKLA